MKLVSLTDAVPKGVAVVAFPLIETVCEADAKLNPVTPMTADDVAFAVTSAECVCRTVVPFSVHNDVNVVKLVPLLEAVPSTTEDVKLALTKMLCDAEAVVIGAVVLAVVLKPELTAVGAKTVEVALAETDNPELAVAGVKVVSFVSLVNDVALALAEMPCEAVPVRVVAFAVMPKPELIAVGAKTDEVAFAKTGKPELAVGAKTDDVEFAETEKPELTVALAVIGAEWVCMIAVPFSVHRDVNVVKRGSLGEDVVRVAFELAVMPADIALLIPLPVGPIKVVEFPLYDAPVPVGPITWVVDDPLYPVVVVIGAECVWSTAVPFSVHVERKVVNWVPDAVAAPTSEELVLMENVLDVRSESVPMLPVPVGPAVSKVDEPL